MTFVDLFRRFRDLTQAELDEPELLAAFNELETQKPVQRSVQWSELLDHPRVLLLAEAGSGKTAEMCDQVGRLRAEGKGPFQWSKPVQRLEQGGSR